MAFGKLFLSALGLMTVASAHPLGMRYLNYTAVDEWLADFEI